MVFEVTLSVYLLDKANHGIATVGVEWVIVGGFHAYECALTVAYWIWTYWWFYIIPEISSKSSSIIKFNSHGLIIDSTPSSLHRLSTILCDCYEIVFKLNFPDIFLSKVEHMIFR